MFQKVTQVEVPSGIDLWSDHTGPKYPLIGVKCARITVCGRSVLETVSDQTFPDGKDLWSDENQTIVHTIVQSWPRQNSDQRPDDWALKITADQTIVRSKVTPDQSIVRSKSHLIRLNCARSSLIGEWSSQWTNFDIIYSFQKNWCFRYEIHLKKRPF